MTWGLELWDQFENVDKYFQHGIDFGEKYAKFVKERCSIEQDYAARLRKLVKGYQPKKRDEDRNIYSTNKAFQSQLSELNDIAGQHEVVAEEMLAEIVKTCLNSCSDFKLEKKRLYQEGRNQQSALDNHERNLEQMKKKFEKEWKDCERLQGIYEKLDADINVTKADVEKAKHTWQAKKDVVETCRADYGAILVQFNQAQKAHYEVEMPKIFEGYAEADQRRIQMLQDRMSDFAKVDGKVKPIVQKCLDGMEQAARAINPQLDADFVVERLKSGFVIPGDKEFEDFMSSSRNNNEVEEKSATLQPQTKHTKKSGLSWLFGQKKVAESPDFSHLPPEQRKKKLQHKIDDIRKELHKEEDGRRGILKMQDVYRGNPALGDPNSIEPQIRMANQQLDKLQADLHQHETWYADATGKPPPTSSGKAPTRPTPPTAATATTASINNIPPAPSMTSSIPPAPTSSVIPPPPPSGIIPPPPPLTGGGIPPAPQLSNNVPPAPPIVNEPLPPVPDVNGTHDDHDVIQRGSNGISQMGLSFGDEFDEETEPIGTCVALYDYDANSEGELTMKEGEKFQVLEADNGDGWTRVMNDVTDGYIPTSYVDLTFFT